MHKDVIVIGAGASGVGIGVVLKKMELNFLIIEQGQIAESFRHWPPGTRLLSPSFTGNFFGSPDLNAVTPDTSPAYQLNTEHPTGDEYASYLENVAAHHELPIAEKTKVISIKKEKDIFSVTTNEGDFTANVVVWAGGEYQFPNKDVCKGAEHAIHNTQVSSWESFKNDPVPIIGGYESAFDSAIQLAKLQKKSVIFDSENHIEEARSDSSFSLSPYTKDRFRQYQEYITIKSHTHIEKIEKEQDQYRITSTRGEEFTFDSQPILATGFKTSLVQVKNFFKWKDDTPQLTENDESTIVKNFFLVGPQVKHRQVIFCFIYKFRQRFAVVAKAIAESIGVGEKDAVQETVQEYQQKNFYLNDLSCCEDECVC